MKKKLMDFTFCLFCFISIIFIFKNNKEVANIILEAVNLFFKKVFVSLFPMFILNDILINLNIPYYFYLLFNKLFLKVFHTSGLGAYVFIMSLISGTPSNAYILKELVELEKLSIEEANHFLTFTYFSNPLFLTVMLSTIFNARIVLKIILCHYIANIIIGILMRNKAPKIVTNQKYTQNKSKSSIIKSINKSISTLLMILGTICFYMLLTFIVMNLLPDNLLIKTLISGFLEITNGLNTITSLNFFIQIKEIIATAIISFGGLSIHTQIKSILEDTKMNYSYFFKGRIMQTIISVILIILF